MESWTGHHSFLFPFLFRKPVINFMLLRHGQSFSFLFSFVLKANEKFHCRLSFWFPGTPNRPKFFIFLFLKKCISAFMTKF